MKNFFIFCACLFFFVLALFFSFNLALIFIVLFCVSVVFYGMKLVLMLRKEVFADTKIKSIISLFSDCFYIVVFDAKKNKIIFSNNKKFLNETFELAPHLSEKTDRAINGIKHLKLKNLHFFARKKMEPNRFSLFENTNIPVIAIKNDQLLYSNASAKDIDLFNADTDKFNIVKLISKGDEEVLCAFPICKNDVDVFVESSPLPSIKVSNNGIILTKNNIFKKIFQSRSNDLFELFGGQQSKRIISFMDGKHVSEIINYDFIIKGTHKKYKHVILSIMPVGKEFIFQFFDISRHKEVEANLTHSQKMQAVGRLAGGIAHDFNNLLTAMHGYCDLLLVRHPVGDPSFADVMQIKQNVSRSTSLVKQLLAISRKEIFTPKKIDLNDTIDDLSNLITRLTEGKIKLSKDLNRNLNSIKIDQSQLEQVLINLVVNARDAINSSKNKDSGDLVIKTENTSLKTRKQISSTLIDFYSDTPFVKGEYVMLSIKDNGTGIKKEILKKIFEPYYSTKKSGEGTGLGLSTIYGIVRQAQGYLLIDTETGKGTEFQILFPAYLEYEEDEVVTRVDEIIERDLTGNENILLVEDEAPVRMFSSHALESKGYQVTQAESIEEAVSVIDSKEHDFQLIISDVMLSGISGIDMLSKFQKTHKDLKIILISGYGEGSLSLEKLNMENVSFLQKPFELNDLIKKVRNVLDNVKNR